MATAELSRSSLPTFLDPPVGQLAEECQASPVRLAFRFGPTEGPELADSVRGSALAWRETVAALRPWSGRRLELVETRHASAADVWIGTLQTLEQEFAAHGSTEHKTFLVLDPPRRESVLADDHRCFWIGAGPDRRIDALAAWLSAQQGTRTWCALDRSKVDHLSAIVRTDDVRIEGVDVMLLGNVSEDDLPALVEIRRHRPLMWIALSAPPRNAKVIVDALRHRIVWTEDWHPRLCESGARELNTRYATTFDTSMTSAAWRAWLGVKCVAQAARYSELSELSSALLSTEIEGHKGITLGFDKDRCLAYPLCVVGPEDHEHPVLASVMP